MKTERDSPNLRPTAHVRSIEREARRVRKRLMELKMQGRLQVGSIDDAVNLASTIERLSQGVVRLNAEDAIVLEEKLELLVSALQIKINFILAS